MALYKSGNPALRESTFTSIGRAADSTDVMTISGTVNKIGVLLLILFGTATISWLNYTSGQPALVMPLILVGAIGGLIVAIATSVKKTLSPYLAPLYAALEGLCLGGLSALFNEALPGIVISALLLTFGILFSLLAIYKMRLIKVTENFKLMVASATAGIAFYYLISMVMRLFGIEAPFIHETGTFGIIFSLVVIVIASLNLVMDFDFIEAGADAQAPKYMEWYAAFGLMVTLIWLYLEILRLLAKLRR